MRLIITDSIYRQDHLPHLRTFGLRILKKAARKALAGFGAKLRSPGDLPKAALRKLYLTGPGGSGRAVFMLLLNKRDTLLVMLRPKNDKRIGSNMSMGNPRFKKELIRRLDQIMGDIETKSFRSYELK